MPQNHCLGQADVELLCTGQRHVQGSSQGDQLIKQFEEHLIWLVWSKEMPAVSHQNDEQQTRKGVYTSKCHPIVKAQNSVLIVTTST